MARQFSIALGTGFEKAGHSLLTDEKPGAVDSSRASCLRREISAVCTEPAHRGRGLATRLVPAVAAGIRERGEIPFLHASATNVTAIRLYEPLGFRVRRTTTFGTVRVPGGRTAVA
jgi:ribosomal protein S18 acetylase RimI-like enzyme